MVATATAPDQEFVAPNGVQAWCTRNAGWAFEDNVLKKVYTFPTPALAARFAVRSVLRATRGNVALSMSISGPRVDLFVRPAGDRFRRAELQTVRRYDLEPKAAAAAPVKTGLLRR